MTELSSAEKVDRIKAMYGAFFALDASKMDELLGPEFIVNEAAPLPYSGTWAGTKGLIKLLTTFGETCNPDWKMDIMDFSVSDDKVVAHLHLALTGKKSGQSFSMPVIEVWRFKEDKIVEMTVFYFDVKLVSEVLG